MAAKSEKRARFDLDTLRRLAGQKAFERGKEYYEDGQVEILALETGRVLAQVAGTEDYRTELTGIDQHIGGECSCRAFTEWGFCKHLVAVALAANAVREGAEGDGALSRIRDYLKNKGTDALVEMIVGLAERDPGLFRKLNTAAAATSIDDKELEPRLRKTIDAATRTGGEIDYWEVSDWAAEVDAALDPLADLASGPRAGLALQLTARALDRIQRAMAVIDDSDGHCSGVLHRAREIHLNAARLVRPPGVQLARELFAREMKDHYDSFDRSAALYADVLGEEGLAEYRRLASKAWDKLPGRGEGGTRQETPEHYDRLKAILDFFAEREGDVEMGIALRARDLSSPWNYLQLAEFCRAEGREEEALRRAEEGLRVFEDGGPEEGLVCFAANLLHKAGRPKEAEAHLQRAFGKAPSLRLYNRLRALGGEAAGEQAVKLLQARLDEKEGTGSHVLADLLISVLMEEKAFDAAWAVLRKHGASIGVKEALAQASETTHSAEAVEVYTERVAQLASVGGNGAYAQAARLVARMAALRNAAEQAAYVAALKARFGRKRNFMKLLE